jgi:hypothetical protein
MDAVVAAFEELVALQRAPAQPASSPDDRPDLGLTDLIPAADGAELAHRAKSTMNTWCRKHPINGGEGFAQQIGTRWYVSRSRLRRHLKNTK